ncbi:MAG TPA: DUF882 domain-containing protein [Burkholderiaceae bacterium]|nr:DUF882 domain-containing protein [Burkholderiaceae bacterium]
MAGSSGVTRRQAVGAGAALAAAVGAGGVPATVRAAATLRGPAGDPAFWKRPRELWITRPQVGEQLRAVYWSDGRVQQEGYQRINRLYRDVMAGQQRPISIDLLDLNYVMQTAVHRLLSPRPLVLISGFRTAQTNARVGGVEPNIHFTGQADDSVYERMSLADNYRLARYFQVGGLGFYPDRGSIHKDVGPRRSWVEYGPARPRRA